MFTKAGNPRVRITQVMLAQPKFNDKDPNAFDVAILAEDVTDSSQSDWWHGEISGKYGTGNVAHLTQAQLTMQALERLGYQGQGIDIAALNALVGLETEGYVQEREYNGKKYYDLKRLGESSLAPKPLDPQDMARRLAAMGLAPQPQPPQGQPAPPQPQYAPQQPQPASPQYAPPPAQQAPAPQQPQYTQSAPPPNPFG